MAMTAWDGARCLDHDGDLNDWFPEFGHQNSVEVRPLRQVCACCPLREKCLELAVATCIRLGELHGVWGGLTAPEIMKAVRKREAGTPALLALSRRKVAQLPGSPLLSASRQRAVRELASRRAARKNTPYRGVFWNRPNKKWIAQIVIDGKQSYLGSFTDDRDAAHAYDAAVLRSRTRKTRLNFPEEAP